MMFLSRVAEMLKPSHHHHHHIDASFVVLMAVVVVVLCDGVVTQQDVLCEIRRVNPGNKLPWPAACDPSACTCNPCSGVSGVVCNAQNLITSMFVFQPLSSFF